MDMDSDVPALVPMESYDVDRRRVPITILTGFLGSGKTTLLQNILRAEHGLKVAVLMNEFAESTLLLCIDALLNYFYSWGD